jgi:hypothetical protein
MNTKNKRCVAALLLYFITHNYATADELYLKNGDRITGQVIELSTTHCTFKTNYQARLHIKRSNISRLNITQPVTSDDPAPFSTITTEQLFKAQGKGTEETPKQTKSTSPNILGEEPDEDLRQIFLRQSTVLLKPGDKELDISVSYTRDEYANLRTRQD